ncbi:hypothetical protein [Tenuibacillus multivorans]|uniref:hypothetical protein n=1 Tax=Tenuibacillus multivorans TaxID=237069 RepID=UPI001649A7BD|nr:hypothetical protein [Tenuibacillus multivorans]
MLIIVNACSDQEKVIEKIEDKSVFNVLIIQKVEGNTSSNDMTKIVKDQQKIVEVLSMVEGLKVEEVDNNLVIEEMTSQNAYMFGFIENEKMTGDPLPYSFNVLADGTFIFSHDEPDSLSKPLQTVDQHQQLLDEMKQLLDIDF